MQTRLDLIPQGGPAQGFFHNLIQGAATLYTLQAKTISHVLINTLGEWIGLLEHHSHALTQVSNLYRRRINILTVQLYTTLDTNIIDQVVHTIDAAQQGRFSATTWSDKCRYTLARDAHTDIVQCLCFTVVQIKIFHLQADILCTGIVNATRTFYDTGINSLCVLHFHIHPDRSHCSSER